MGRKACCNPLGRPKHGTGAKNLQPPTSLILDFCEGRVLANDLICMACRISIYGSRKNSKTIHQVIPQEDDDNNTAGDSVLEAEK